jgi:hypothetical protein
MTASDGSNRLMAKFGHKRVAGSPTADVDQALADSIGVSLDHLQKNIYSILPTLSEADAADIDDSSFLADTADAGEVVAPAQADEPISTPQCTPQSHGEAYPQHRRWGPTHASSLKASG